MTKKITDPPTNVKEAIDWLLRVARKDDTYQDGFQHSELFCTSVKKLLGNGANIEKNSFDKLFTALGKFIGWEKNDNGSNGKTGHIKNGTSKGIGKSNENNGQGYQSAYKNDENDLMTRWMSCGTRNLLRTAAKCCASDGGEGCGDCKADQSKACDGCCKDCPQQICARIFCLIVPVLYRVFWYMQAKCNKGKAWEKQQVNGNNNGDGKTDLKEFMEACGFDASQLKNTKGEDLTKKSNGTASLLGSIASELGMMKRGIDTALQNESNDPSKNFLKGASNQAAKKPSSLTDLLLWLQFLPYCSQYGEVIKEVKNKLNGNDKEKFVQYLKESISELPMLFLQIEGKGERQNGTNGSSLFLKISELSKCQYIFHEDYYKDNEKVCKMLLCVFPVIHWGLTALKDKCKTSSCNNTITSCTATKNLLTSLGWNGSKESQKADEFPPIIYENAKCQPLKDYLDKQLLGSNDSLGGMKSILESAWQKENGPKGFDTQGQYLPQTIYEMLIWLMGLPVSERYKELKGEITSKLSSNGVSVDTVMPEFTKILFQVPHLFLTLNGDLSGMLSSMFQCHGISDSSKAYQYGNNGSECLKIFSAIVAILFPVIRYLQQRCKDGDVFANGESWQNTQINADNLAEFLKFMGFTIISSNNKIQGSQFHTTVLHPIFGDVTPATGGTGQLKTLYECAHEHLKTQSSNNGSPTAPTTIRQMMLWLIGLPVTSQYGDNGSGLINTATTKASSITDLQNKINGSDSQSLHYQLQHSIVGMMTIISQIEGGLGSVVEFLKEGFKDTNGGGSSGTSFKYGEQAELFTQFTTYVTSVHVQLRFLNVMCGRQKDQGGWKECKYAGNASCTCNTTLKISCLKLFLQNGNSGSGSGTNMFKLMNGSSEHLQMGFNAHSPQDGNITGASITPYLEPLLDPIPTTTTAQSPPSPSSKPLSLLTQYCVAMGQLQPQSLGDLFAFFAHLGQSWDNLELHGQNGGTFNQKLTEELGNYNIGDYGEKQACDELQKKIKAILNSEHTDHNKSLMSLMCSTGNSSGSSNGCAPYMKSLSQGVYQYYCPEITGADPEKNQFTFLQYLYDMLKKLLDKMKELQKEFNECECCKTEPKGTPCENLISCQYAHPIIYKFGFVFGEPKDLNGNSNKSCTDIKTQLDVVLDCTQDKKSALFSAFECVIQVTYKVLLEKAKACVTKKYPTSNGNSELNTAFTLYVTNAMYQSYPTLICTFACKVFKDGQCDGVNCKNFQSKIAAPNPKIPASLSPIKVSSSAVTTITPIIPQYTAPPIDPYHYRTFNKTIAQTGASASEATNYSFQSALDFHVQGAQCISPAPVALRTLIDWILRVTTGAIATQDGNTNGNNSNDNIKHLSEAIKKVLKGSGMDVTGDTEVNGLVTALVDGLRKFMGYQDRSQKVKGDVTTVLGTNGTNGVKKLLGDKITTIDGYLKKKSEFASELGKALLKGRYEGTFKQRRDGAIDTIISTIALVTETITGIQEPLEQKTFKDVVTTLQSCLTHNHTCQTGLKCTEFNKDSSSKSTSSGTVTADGLKQLHDFFSKLSTFATLWTTIGNKTGTSKDPNPSSDVVHTQKTRAATEVSQKCNGSSSSNNTEYFTKLYQALEKLGQCAQKVQALNGGNGYNDSQKYRTKITAVITHLNNEVLSKLTDSKDTDSANKADPVYAVNGAKRLIEETKSKVEAEITKQMHNTILVVYAYKDSLNINTLIQGMNGAVSGTVDAFKSHLDDLKQLCQWLHRMSQLYKHGLKGFVESLVKHLEHIVQVIKWIEKLKVFMSIVMNSNDAQAAEVQQSITAGTSTIAKLLSSYVLKDADNSLNIAGDKASSYRQLLRDLRLLALDRYTLQVWQDECNPNDNRQSAIKNWITFENGIVKHSAVGDIKQKLHELTGIDYSSNASSASSPTPRNRIQNFHAICVIQKFSYEAPIAELEKSLKELKGIKERLEGVKERCNGSTTNVSTVQEVQTFCTLVTEFLAEKYGIFSFAKFVHTIMGPNIFSAVIGALEELKDKEKYKNNGDGNLDKIRGILEVFTEGLQSDTEKREHYTLTYICENLESFIATLRKEYIFAYPVVTCKAQQKVAAQQSPQSQSPAQPQALPTTVSTLSAQSIMDRLKNVMLPCAKNFHNDASVCNSCYNIFAYILLGQVPKLYHSFKFMSWISSTEWKSNASDASITFYLVSMGFNIGNIQNGSTNTGGKQLHETFKSAVDGFKNNPSPPTPSYEPKGLKDIHDKLESYLKKLLQVQHEQALQSIAKGGNDKRRRPRTIREMLHWLSGVPFSVGYEGMQKFSNSLCDSTLALTNDNGEQKMKHTIQPEWISYRLGVSCAECLDVLQAVEDPLGKEPQKRYREYIATHDFYYPASPSELFYMFVDIIYNVYVQMKFVCNMTGRERNDGGWKSCEFINTKALILQNYNKDTVQCKCNLNFVEYTCAGPLRRLLSSVSTVFTGKSLGFQLPEEKLYDASVVGSVIHNVIKHIFGKGDNYPTLCRFLLAVSTCPPTSIGDMISFLYWYKQRMFVGNSADENSKKTADIYKNALHHEIELFPGTFDASKLTGALGALMSAHTGTSGRTTSGTTHTHNLSSVMYCEDAMVVKPQPQPPAPAPQTQQPSDPSASCAPYLRPLAQEIYNVYVPQFSRAYLSWILHFGPRVYTALEELKGKLNGNCEHCKKSDSSIVTCNSVLPELYSKGLDFYDPKVLNGQKKNQRDGSYQPNGGTKRTCVFFATQLGEVLKPCNPKDPSAAAPLHRLIEAIEQFLWSIRMPFSLVQLSLWSVAILFISYVFVVPLDHFKIKSHLFNRLKYTMHPSLLIADQQRRVSEVAYFSL